MIRGKMVNLRMMRISDLPVIFAWRQDADLLRYYDELPTDTPSEVEEDLYHKLNSSNRIDYIIETKHGESIGMIFFTDINWKNRNAEFQIMIGEKEKRHRAYGVEAELLMLVHAFHHLNMHKIYAQVIEYAKESERLIKEVGFRREAVLRNKFFQNNRYWDLYLYGLTNKEFNMFLDTPKARRYLKRKGIYVSEFL